VLIDQAMREENSLTIQVNADRVEQIQALPGVLSVRVGDRDESPTQERPPRGDIPSGTRLPPLQPPGYN
jgi:hypothetical protein